MVITTHQNLTARNYFVHFDLCADDLIFKLDLIVNALIFCFVVIVVSCYYCFCCCCFSCIFEFLEKESHNEHQTIGAVQNFGRGNLSRQKTYNPHCFRHGLVRNKTAA